MTVKQGVTVSQNRDNCLQKSIEVETDQKNIGSLSDDMESPRSVVRGGQWTVAKKVVRGHSQVLRIREEDSHLGEDTRESSSHGVQVMPFLRPVLPASPLSPKTAMKKTLH